MFLNEEFIKVYENLSKLNEWVDSQGNKVNNQTTPNAQQPPVKIKKRKQVKNKFGILVDDWSKEFIKLGQHIWDVHGKPVDEQDSRVGPSLFRIYFDMPSGEEWRLEVTTTRVDSSKGLKMLEYWDYVLSTYRNGSEVTISRGHVQDYNALLDILLNQGVITNK